MLLFFFWKGRLNYGWSTVNQWFSNSSVQRVVGARGQSWFGRPPSGVDKQRRSSNQILPLLIRCTPGAKSITFKGFTVKEVLTSKKSSRVNFDAPSGVRPGPPPHGPHPPLLCTLLFSSLNPWAAVQRWVALKSQFLKAGKNREINK